MRKTSAVLVACFTAASFAIAQTNRRGINDPPPRHGRAFLISEPSFVPLSLEDAVRKADLAILGRVESVLPSRVHGNDPFALETDSVVSVLRVLKGSVAPPTKVLVSQPGGERAGFKLVPTQDQLMQAGQEYVLFLTQDERPMLPKSGMARYALTGEWSGKFAVENSKIRTSPHSAKGICSYEGWDAGAFIARVAALVETPPQ